MYRRYWISFLQSIGVDKLIKITNAHVLESIAANSLTGYSVELEGKKKKNYTLPARSVGRVWHGP